MDVFGFGCDVSLQQPTSFSTAVKRPQNDVHFVFAVVAQVLGDRVKLFRFDSELQQWKERGIGELKILRALGTTRFRIIMRREQVRIRLILVRNVRMYDVYRLLLKQFLCFSESSLIASFNQMSWIKKK